MVDEETSLKEIISQAVSGIVEVAHEKNVAVLGAIEFELSVVTKKTMGGKLRFMLAEAGAKYDKEEVSKIKFYIGTRGGRLYDQMGWRQ